MSKKLVWLLEHSKQPFKVVKEERINKKLFENAGIELSTDPNYQKAVYLEAPLAEFGEDNGDNALNVNDRWYSKDEYLAEVDRVQTEINEGAMFGSPDHPEDGYSVSMKEVSHMITKLWYNEEDGRVWVQIKLLPTIKGGGYDLLVIHHNGGLLKGSARAIGFYDEDTKKAVLDSFFTVDIVSQSGFEFVKFKEVANATDGQHALDMTESDQKLYESKILKNGKKMQKLSESNTLLKFPKSFPKFKTGNDSENWMIANIMPSDTSGTLENRYWMEIKKAFKSKYGMTLDEFHDFVDNGGDSSTISLNESSNNNNMNIKEKLKVGESYMVKKDKKEAFMTYEGEDKGVFTFDNSGEKVTVTEDEIEKVVSLDESVETDEIVKYMDSIDTSEYKQHEIIEMVCDKFNLLDRELLNILGGSLNESSNSEEIVKLTKICNDRSNDLSTRVEAYKGIYRLANDGSPEVSDEKARENLDFLDKLVGKNLNEEDFTFPQADAEVDVEHAEAGEVSILFNDTSDGIEIVSIANTETGETLLMAEEITDEAELKGYSDLVATALDQDTAKENLSESSKKILKKKRLFEAKKLRKQRLNESMKRVEVINRFFQEYPEFRSEYTQKKKHNDYSTDARIAFNDYSDMLHKNGDITEDQYDNYSLGGVGKLNESKVNITPVTKADIGKTVKMYIGRYAGKTGVLSAYHNKQEVEVTMADGEKTYPDSLSVEVYSLNESAISRPKKGDKLYDKKTNSYVEVTRSFKPKAGSALENEPFLVDIKYPDGKKAINMPVGNRFVIKGLNESVVKNGVPATHFGIDPSDPSKKTYFRKTADGIWLTFSEDKGWTGSHESPEILEKSLTALNEDADNYRIEQLSNDYKSDPSKDNLEKLKDYLKAFNWQKEDIKEYVRKLKSSLNESLGAFAQKFATETDDKKAIKILIDKFGSEEFDGEHFSPESDPANEGANDRLNRLIDDGYIAINDDFLCTYTNKAKSILNESATSFNTYEELVTAMDAVSEELKDKGNYSWDLFNDTFKKKYGTDWKEETAKLKGDKESSTLNESKDDEASYLWNNLLDSTDKSHFLTEIGADDDAVTKKWSELADNIKSIFTSQYADFFLNEGEAEVDGVHPTDGEVSIVFNEENGTIKVVAVIDPENPTEIVTAEELETAGELEAYNTIVNEELNKDTVDGDLNESAKKQKRSIRLFEAKKLRKVRINESFKKIIKLNENSKLTELAKKLAIEKYGSLENAKAEYAKDDAKVIDTLIDASGGKLGDPIIDELFESVKLNEGVGDEDWIVILEKDVDGVSEGEYFTEDLGGDKIGLWSENKKIGEVPRTTIEKWKKGVEGVILESMNESAKKSKLFESAKKFKKRKLNENGYDKVITIDGEQINSKAVWDIATRFDTKGKLANKKAENYRPEIAELLDSNAGSMVEFEDDVVNMFMLNESKKDAMNVRKLENKISNLSESVVSLTATVNAISAQNATLVKLLEAQNSKAEATNKLFESVATSMSRIDKTVNSTENVIKLHESAQVAKFRSSRPYLKALNEDAVLQVMTLDPEVVTELEDLLGDSAQEEISQVELCETAKLVSDELHLIVSLS